LARKHRKNSALEFFDQTLSLDAMSAA
jgi:hypothetical protein